MPRAWPVTSSHGDLRGARPCRSVRNSVPAACGQRYAPRTKTVRRECAATGAWARGPRPTALHMASVRRRAGPVVMRACVVTWNATRKPGCVARGPKTGKTTSIGFPAPRTASVQAAQRVGARVIARSAAVPAEGYAVLQVIALATVPAFAERTFAACSGREHCKGR